MRCVRALATLGVAGLVLSACHEPGIETLAARLGERRRIEPRLTGGFAHARCQTETSAPDLIPDPRCSALPSDPSLGRIVARMGRQRGGRPSSAAFHEQGIGELILGEGPESAGRAVAALEQAVAAAPHDARLLSDLSAAYLVRAQRDDEPLDLMRGLSTAERALHEKGDLAEARFNRALALQLLFLETEAVAAWQQYLETDSSSAWAREAEARIVALGAPRNEWTGQQLRLRRAMEADDRTTIGQIVRRHPQEAREWAELKLLGDWADAVEKKDHGRAAQALRMARLIGEALAATGGDRLTQDAVAAIDGASASQDRDRLSVLAEGHLAFQEGHGLYDRRDTDSAVPRLEEAADKLRRAGSPFASRAVFFLACSDTLRNRYARSLETLSQLGRELEGKPYGGLLGHVAWMEALNRIDLGQAMGAIESYGRSIELYRRSGEVDNLTSTEALLAQTLSLVGHRQEALRHAYRALRSVRPMRNPSLQAMVFSIAADTVLQEGEMGAALLFQDEVVRSTQRSNPLRQVEARIWRGMLAQQLGRRDLALADFRAAERQIPDIADRTLNARKRADLAMAQGAFDLERKPRRAIALLTSALDVYEKEQSPVLALRAHRLRARALRLAGDDRLAELDLKAGLKEFEYLGGGLSTEELRIAFLEESEGIFDEMISFQADRRTDLAFAYADRARTRVLPGSASKLWDERADRPLRVSEPRPLGLEEIRRRMPAGTSLVQFSVQPDRVLVWSLGRRGAWQFAIAVPKGRLSEKIRRLRYFQPAEAAAWRAVSAELFDLLVRPWLAEVDARDRLVFVPDKSLHALPFASLLDRRSGRYLIEEHEILIAPSATLYINALDREHRWSGAPFSARHALVIGDPAFDAGRFPLLGRLSHAREEATRVALLHGLAPLIGKAADRRSFLERAPGAEWIHFAGHSVIDPRNSLLSELVLARAPGEESGAVAAHEIYQLDLRSTRLVILAACDTGPGYRPGSEGVSGFARAFFAAGAPTVVASLWKVDDETTGTLLYAFHRNLLVHPDPARALREAQLASLRSRNEKQRSPAAWGAFEVIGASARESD